MAHRKESRHWEAIWMLRHVYRRVLESSRVSDTFIRILPLKEIQGEIKI